MSHENRMTYKDAGVDIDAGNALVERIKPLVQRTLRPEVLTGLGGFGGLCALPQGLKEPVLVSGTDGVGTKLKLAQRLQRHDTIGIDLVAMCVNDVVVQGAEPLFFLDYFATGKLDTDTAAAVISGIAAGCELAGCALIGGETAEMPDMYAPGDYDLAGFNVGVVERERLVTGEHIQAGDCVIGLASSGPHSNGYSLIRRILERTEADLEQRLNDQSDDQSLGDALMAPTRIYVKPVLEVMAEHPVHGMAHITGGGLKENIIRVVPESLGVQIDLGAWTWPAVFRWLQQGGSVETLEMLTTFNCGIGYTLIAPAAAADAILGSLQSKQIDARVIGQIVAGDIDGRIEFVGSTAHAG